MQLLNGEGREAEGQFSAPQPCLCLCLCFSNEMCLDCGGFFKSLSNKTLSVCFPQTAKNCGGGSLLKPGVVFKAALIF